MIRDNKNEIFEILEEYNIKMENNIFLLIVKLKK